ncbi:MAG: NAD-dependent succinate-semialdehyde dehydrogenase [bacterium]|nr:NAD-dependent succinate-semialdehyde dehydrogenase [bacterium]
MIAALDRLAGLLLDGDAGADDHRLDVFDPTTGEAIAAIATSSVDDCLAAVEAASHAARGWADAPPRERGEILRRCYETMMAEQAEIATLLQLENGKPMAEALGEVAYAADFFRWFSEEAVRIAGEVRRSPIGDKRIMVLPEPVGVSLQITPWNFPAAMPVRKIAPALAAGCTTVVKPAPATPLTAYCVAELMGRCGVPEGVVNLVLPEPPNEATVAMLAHRAVRKVSFTGSIAVGKHLLRLAADRVLRTSMELGGNAPFVVLADADLDVAVRSAVAAKMRNTGATCVAPNRLYVHERIAHDFTEALSAAMAGLAVGYDRQPDAEVGALISPGERDKVAGLVSGAVDGGAKVVTGGRAPDSGGYFYEPTVLADVAPDAPILAGEIFGPVAPVVRFSDEARAVEMANDTDAGLIAYVMSGDMGHGLAIGEQLDAGMVAVNRGIISDASAPFGGVKESGIGREGGFEGIEEYLERKYVATDW